MLSNDVVQILSTWLRFSDASSRSDNLAAFCPFHKQGKEESPALYVYVGKPRSDVHPGSAFCHACNRGWTFTSLLYGLGANREIIDAIKARIAEDAKYAVVEDRVATLNFDNPHLREQVLAVFDYCPRELLKKGFDKQMLRENDVGFDRDRSRITFGIRDHHGNLVGVSGRSVIGEEPRYKVYRSEFYGIYPDYKLEKSKVLWGLDKFYQTRLHFPDDGPVVVCEGFKAALWTKQAGFDSTVALMGVALSLEQIVLLSRITNEVVLFLDNNTAGRRSTWKNSGLLQGVDLKVVDYDSQYDLQPDDLTLERVRELIENAPSARQWRKKHHGLERLLQK